MSSLPSGTRIVSPDKGPRRTLNLASMLVHRLHLKVNQGLKTEGSSPMLAALPSFPFSQGRQTEVEGTLRAEYFDSENRKCNLCEVPFDCVTEPAAFGRRVRHDPV